MARPSKTGGKTSEAKARNAKPAKGRKTTKTTARIAPAATRVKRRSIAEDLKEAREQQAATAEILKVIASSPDDVQPVFDAIAHSAKRLIGGFSTAVHRIIEDFDHLVAFTPTNPASDAALKAAFPRHLSKVPAIALGIRNGETAQVSDSEAADAGIRELGRARGWRSATYTPLMDQGTFIGFIVSTRRETGMLADHHVQLLRTFADQAVIAIKNVGLFNEVQARTRDLSESLQQQTATADVLKVISRSAFDLDSVMNALTHSAAELCSASVSALYLREGDLLVARGISDVDGQVAEFLRQNPVRVSDETYSGRAVMTGMIANVADADSESNDSIRKFAKAVGYRAILVLPLMREGRGVGVFALARKQVGAFTQRQIELVQTFADQAVIAIENVRLFDEVQAKTRDLTEALHQQTATSDVLKVIASSPTNVEPALRAIVESACAFCGAYDAGVLLKIGEDLHFSAHHGPIRTGQQPRPISREWVTGRSVVDKKPMQVSDFEAPEAAEFPEGQRQSREQGHRCTLSVPLLREGEAIGAIALRRLEPVAFNDKQVALLQTFADQAVIAIGNVRLFEEVQAKTRDLSEALTYQTASANILRVIASSPTDVQPALKAIAESACELCEAHDAIVLLKDGNDLRFNAHHGPIPIVFEKWPINRRWTVGRAFMDRKAVYLRDLLSDEGDDFPDSQKLARRSGNRSTLSVPLLREGESIGVIALRRTEVRPFTDKQIALLQTFADQAVIAIGNVRLFEEVQARTHELAESLEQQTATSEVLSVISRSAGDLAPVFDAMLGKAMQLCNANFGVLNTYDGAYFHTAATYGLPPAYDEFRRKQPLEYGPATAPARLLRGETFVEISDLLESEAYRNAEPNRRALVDLGGARCLLAVPLLKDGRVVGNVLIFRQENRRFSEKQITLLQQFAAQAVIAIENARLLNELRQRTDDLSESLQQQTATSEVLKVISSSPGALEPVFRSMLENAVSICDAKFGNLFLVDGDTARWEAGVGTPPKLAEYFTQSESFRPTPGSHLDRVMRTRQVSHTPDDTAEAVVGAAARLGGARSTVCVPMVKDDALVGTIFIYRTEVRPFTDKQIDLVKNFAAQAVIAIENARLLKELRQRTDDLSESLEQQTATSEVLETISSSPGELEPVFQKMLENATRVCGANFGSMNLWDGEKFTNVARHNMPPAFAALQQAQLGLHPDTPMAEVVKTHQVVHVDDFRNNPAYLAGIPHSVAIVDIAGARTLVVVPMLKEDELIGAITIFRQEVRPFTDKQIALVENFTKQAVIAIENTRLLRELRERTEALTQSLDDLRTAQDRLVQTEKLASLGQLTAGIAHEIKNPLNFVNNFSALSAELTDELNDVLKPVAMEGKVRSEVDELTGLLKDNLEKVVQHGKRADSIVKNMLLHSREGSGEHRPADINSLLDESLNLAYHGARAEKGEFNIILQRDFDADAGTIELFPQEITRAFLNLIANGVYAATSRKTADNEPGFEPILRATTKNLGTTVEIRIRDNGTGIPSEVKEKMFNPFFTTKPAGEGTGLGLSMTHDIIVKQHGGVIDVATEPGQFTEFIIILPRKGNVSGRDRGKT